MSQELADGARLEDEGEDPHRATALVRGAEAAALTGLATYPELSAVCEREERDVGYPHALTNPVVLVEVLGPSSEEYDRGEKLDDYKRIPGLQEVVLVAHRKPAIEVWRRADGPSRPLAPEAPPSSPRSAVASTSTRSSGILWRGEEGPHSLLSNATQSMTMGTVPAQLSVVLKRTLRGVVGMFVVWVATSSPFA